MNGRFLKGLCVAFGLLCLAAGAVAQDNAIFSADRMARAEGDIAKMDETELRSLTAVLVDCAVSRVIAGPEALSACRAAHEKYQIEYRRGRGIDEVLYLWLIATAMQTGKSSTTMSFVFEGEPREPFTVEMAMRLMEKLESTASQPTVRLGADSAPQISLNDIRQAIGQAGSDAGRTHLRIAEVEQALRRKISETFKSGRA